MGADHESPGDGGILTAESIAALPLRNLELAVLSACETGPVVGAGGEGVFGLQRAFYMAGAQNVVATLWKVDDAASAALMQTFYVHLFVENKPPLEALREAQLLLLQHPEAIDELATTRAPDFSQAVQRVRRTASPASTDRAADVRLWAGFIFSGTGQIAQKSMAADTNPEE